MAAPSPLRIGILGAANIARAFTRAVKPSKSVTIAAVASRDAGKAEKFAAELGIARSLGSYEALLADKAIDAIYNPLPNSLHAEWSIRAAEAGKHVLCEKPLAMNEAEARAMFAAAKRHTVHLVEAYPYMAQPQTLKLRELLGGGAIGKVQLVQASFGVPQADPANIRFNAALGGGALMDAGSYAVSLVRIVVPERPARVHAVARMADSGVDRTLCATLDFASGALAQVSTSFATCYNRHALIAGDAGTIETRYLNHPPIGGPATLTVRRGRLVADPVETVTVADGNGFLAEAESFAAMIAGGVSHWTGASEAESIDIMATLEAIRASARTGQTVAVPAT